MSKSAVRTMTLVAGAAWLIVAGAGIIDGFVDYGDGWALPYTIFALALAVGAALSLAVGAQATQENARPLYSRCKFSKHIGTEGNSLSK